MIAVDFAGLLKKREELLMLNQSLKQELDAMINMEDELCTMWEGPAKEAFDKQFKKDFFYMYSFCTLIDTFALSIEAIIDLYKMADMCQDDPNFASAAREKLEEFELEIQKGLKAIGDEVQEEWNELVDLGKGALRETWNTLAPAAAELSYMIQDSENYVKGKVNDILREIPGFENISDEEFEHYRTQLYDLVMAEASPAFAVNKVIKEIHYARNMKNHQEQIPTSWNQDTWEPVSATYTDANGNVRNVDIKDIPPEVLEWPDDTCGYAIKYKDEYGNIWTSGVAADCHQNATENGVRNIKFVSDSNTEAVYNGNNELVMDERDYGTYNVVDPNKSEVGHGILDVAPWIIWGNTEGDDTTMVDRIYKMSNRTVNDKLS